MTADALTFLGIVLVLTVTPGADMALVMRHVLAHGLRSAWPTLLGIETGLLIHVTACVAGLSVLLRDSDVASTTVKFAGAAWLTWLGISALIAALRRDRNHAHTTSPSDETRLAAEFRRGEQAPPFRVLYLRGLLTNLLNVKIALFYIAFLPQFAPPGDDFIPVALALALVQAVIGLSWLALYALIVARAGTALESSPRIRTAIEAVTGSALIVFGLRLAAASR